MRYLTWGLVALQTGLCCLILAYGDGLLGLLSGALLVLPLSGLLLWLGLVAARQQQWTTALAAGLGCLPGLVLVSLFARVFLP